MSDEPDQEGDPDQPEEIDIRLFPSVLRSIRRERYPEPDEADPEALRAYADQLQIERPSFAKASMRAIRSTRRKKRRNQ